MLATHASLCVLDNQFRATCGFGLARFLAPATRESLQEALQAVDLGSPVLPFPVLTLVVDQAAMGGELSSIWPT
eukprot:10136673-Lingulodinium_polyedra.AAC.1